MTAVTFRGTRGSEAASFPLDALPPAGSAVVIARDGRHVQVQQDGLPLTARLAFSCLVVPEPGDIVLTAMAEGTVWVIGILERLTTGPACLLAEGDLHIASRTGDVAVSAGRDVRVDAASRVSIMAPDLGLHAGSARFVIDELVQIGRRVSFYVTKMRSVGEMIEMFADHVLTRAKRATRFVEEGDHLRAGAIDHRADGSLQLSANVAVITADTIVRVDADQVHLG